MSNCEVKCMSLGRPQYKLLLSKLGRTVESNQVIHFFFLPTSTPYSNRTSDFNQRKQKAAKETIVTHKKKREPIISFDASQKNLPKVLVNSLAPKIIVKDSLFTKVL